MTAFHIDTLQSAGQARRDAAASAPRSFLWSDLIALALASLSGAALSAAGAGLPEGWTVLTLASALGLVFWLKTLGHYRNRQALADQIRPLLIGCGFAALAVSTAQLALGEARLDPGSILKWAAAPASMLAGRFAVREMLKASKAWYAPVTLLAPKGAADAAETLLSENDGHGLTVARRVDLASFAGLDDAALGARLDALGGQTVFLAPDAQTQPLAARIAGRLSARGAAFYYRPDVGRIPTEHVDLLDAPPADGFVMRITDSLDRPLAGAAKRVLDLLTAGLALAVLSPLMGVIALLIRRDGGPALFSQTRVGRAGSTFACLKFRTMSVDAEDRLAALLDADPARKAEWETYQKLSDDPRITPVGRFLRKTSLDELPQLINVLRGEMSLVGPRPMLPEQRGAYGVSLEAYARLRPGLTGLWQVNGRHETSFAERARLDDWYARNWSLWRDGVIVLRTVREVLRGGGG
ncbi:MAG: exopolysaccharide biosynthesis polyprenyl glycosylphosphotransferase [Oceanicaulis sp.]